MGDEVQPAKIEETHTFETTEEGAAAKTGTDGDPEQQEGEQQAEPGDEAKED